MVVVSSMKNIFVRVCRNHRKAFPPQYDILAGDDTTLDLLLFLMS